MPLQYIYIGKIEIQIFTAVMRIVTHFNPKYIFYKAVKMISSVRNIDVDCVAIIMISSVHNIDVDYVSIVMISSVHDIDVDCVAIIMIFSGHNIDVDCVAIIMISLVYYKCRLGSAII